MYDSREDFDKFELDINDLAPISISVYTRLNHFTRCIKSLLSNPLASHTTLYIFSDAPQFGDEEKVEKVRHYAKNIVGFKSVELYFQKNNDYRKNMKDAREIPLLRHGKMIRLEDDVVVSPFFLEFMNKSLVYYKDWDNILAITGYSPPVKQEEYINGDVYLSYYFGGWGHGVWMHKPYLDFINAEDLYADMLKCNLLAKVKKIHPKLPRSLKRMDEGTHFAGDQILTYHMIKHGMFQIKPTKTLVMNIGFDGTGVHCGKNNKFNKKPHASVLDVRLREQCYLSKPDRRQYNYFHGSNLFLLRALKKLSRLVRKLVN